MNLDKVVDQLLEEEEGESRVLTIKFDERKLDSLPDEDREVWDYGLVGDANPPAEFISSEGGVAKYKVRDEMRVDKEIHRMKKLYPGVIKSVRLRTWE